MDFLVKIDASRARVLPPAEHADLIEREWVRGRELRSRNVLRHFWHLPGRDANVGIWSAQDADELDENLRSLPIWPYAEIEVTALAAHPMLVEEDLT